MIVAGCWAAAMAGASAQTLNEWAGGAAEPVRVALVADRAAVRAGEPFYLGVQLSHAPGWHTYWRNPGAAGLATQVSVQGALQGQSGPLLWPVPTRLVEGELGIYGYTGETLLPWAMQLPAQGAQSRVPIQVTVQWLACRDVCIPGEAQLQWGAPQAGPADVVAASPHAAALQAAVAQAPQTEHGLQPRWHTQGLPAGQVALSFVAPPGLSPITHAEFFPYAEGVLQAAAPQRLLQTANGGRLDFVRADAAPFSTPVAGVLVVAGQAFEVQAETVAAPAPAGVWVADVQATKSRPAAASRLQSAALGAAAPSGGPEPESGWGTGVWAALGLALVGGLLLNLMPCVLPVVGLKVLGFADAQAAPDRARALRWGGLAFMTGVLVSFGLLGALLLILRASGYVLGWGFQLQSPAFVAAMTLLFLVLGLNFSGVFEWGYGLTRLAGRGAPLHTLAGAFGAGCLAVVVATPCTAPFMGAALGFALVQPAGVALAVLLAMGVGMALPYGVLSAVPGALRWLPRPGPWMLLVRQSLAFPMYASAAWLVWVLAQQEGVDAVLRILWAGVLVAAAAWLWGPPSGGRRVRWRMVSSGLAVLAAVTWLCPWLARAEAALPEVPMASNPSAWAASELGGAPAWQPWSPEAVAAARAAGQPVLVDFTAAWCITCQANKVLVLQRAEVVAALRAQGVVTLRADWTLRDATIARELARHGRQGVPLYLLYRPDEPEPRMLPELLTVATVLQALAGAL